jgi:hypothetical protein
MARNEPSAWAKRAELGLLVGQQAGQKAPDSRPGTTE